jgi:hypothetical protein
MKSLSRLIISLAGILLLPFILAAQTSYRSVSGKVTIQGTATTNDWEMTSNAIGVTAAFDVNELGQLSDFVGLNFSMGVLTLKSDKQGLDNNAYKAMNAANFAVIKFGAVTGVIKPQGASDYTITANGIMQVAGKSVNTQLVATCVRNADGTLTCNGTKTMKMSEFGVKPPSFMLGAIRVNDQFNATFTVVLKPVQ